MSKAEVSELMPQTPRWQSVDDDTKLEGQFKFENFRETLDFVRQVGELAEAEFHHPLFIKFGWGFAKIVLQTKKIRGLHENDFIIAAKINEFVDTIPAEKDDN